MLRSEWGAPVLKAQLLTALFEKAVAQLKALRGDTAVHFFLIFLHTTLLHQW